MSANEPKHTPGPWETWGLLVCPSDAGPDERAPRRIARVDRSECGGDAEANARLIAAAPDLLEALIAARPYLTWFRSQNSLSDYKCPALRKANAAIAKATGKEAGE